MKNLQSGEVVSTRGGKQQAVDYVMEFDPKDDFRNLVKEGIINI